MSENAVRHAIAVIGTFLGFIIFFAGYKSGQLGWWWSGLGLAALYWAIYTLLEV